MSKKLVLTETTCTMLENLRLALEVLLGTRIRFKSIETNLRTRTGNALIVADEVEQEVTFIHDRSAQLSIGVNYFWYIARFDKPNEVRVILSNNHFGYPATWVVGTSFADRREEPFFGKTSA